MGNFNSIVLTSCWVTVEVCLGTVHSHVLLVNIEKSLVQHLSSQSNQCRPLWRLLAFRHSTAHEHEGLSEEGVQVYH